MNIAQNMENTALYFPERCAVAVTLSHMLIAAELPQIIFDCQPKVLFTNDDKLDAFGDLGFFDDDGYLYILDRLREMIITGGENVYPREVEELLKNNAGKLLKREIKKQFG